MSDVEAFNESIPQWERQADGLRTLSARCDSLVRDHNVRADSLQEFLVSEGIWEGRSPSIETLSDDHAKEGTKAPQLSWGAFVR